MADNPAISSAGVGISRITEIEREEARRLGIELPAVLPPPAPLQQGAEPPCGLKIAQRHVEPAIAGEPDDAAGAGGELRPDAARRAIADGGETAIGDEVPPRPLGVEKQPAPVAGKAAVGDEEGVAEWLVRFAAALIGRRQGGLSLVAILVCMILGGISGSGAADAAAVASVMLPSMLKQGYPRPYCASVNAAAGSTAVLIPPAIPSIVYAVFVPGVSVPGLFIGGLVPSILCGLALMIPAVVLASIHGFGERVEDEVREPLWRTFVDASWRLPRLS